jgi:ABC-type sugar transport system ATPase subunit
MRIVPAGIIATVERVEDLGDSCVVSFLDGEGRLLKMKSDQQPALREGERVVLGFEAEAAHLFDADSGRRLQSAAQ